MNKYIYVKDIGSGSFGVVSTAQNVATKEIVAVKKLKKKYFSWEECLQLRELASLRKMNHPNIVKLKEAIRENGDLFLVFEHCECNLHEKLSNPNRSPSKPSYNGNALGIAHSGSFKMQASIQPPPGNGGYAAVDENTVRSVMFQLLSALSHVHRMGFFHRDIKPENLLLKGDVVKLADFGLAKEIRTRPPFTEYVSTRWYRAPELILRLPQYSSPVDVWGAGAMMGELLLGRPMFPGASEADTLIKIFNMVGTASLGEWEGASYALKKLGFRNFQQSSTLQGKPKTSSNTPNGQSCNSAANVASIVSLLTPIFPHVSHQGVHFISLMLQLNPADRPGALQLLLHPWFTECGDDAFIGVTSGTCCHPNKLLDGNSTIGRTTKPTNPQTAAVTKPRESSATRSPTSAHAVKRPADFVLDSIRKSVSPSQPALKTQPSYTLEELSPPALNTKASPDSKDAVMKSENSYTFSSKERSPHRELSFTNSPRQVPKQPVEAPKSNVSTLPPPQTVPPAAHARTSSNSKFDFDITKLEDPDYLNKFLGSSAENTAF